jgi:hypothetical protein
MVLYIIYYIQCVVIKAVSIRKWVPFTTTWRVLCLRMLERPPVRRVDENELNEQSRTADKGWSYIWGFGLGANNTLPYQLVLLRKGYNCLGL